MPVPMIALVVALAAAPEAASAESAAQAVRLYDLGRYPEAEKSLEALDARGKLTGPLLYRLFFCRRVAGDRSGAQDALDRARKALEEENPKAKTLEVPFYLANAYQNMGRPADAAAVAKAATDKVASGAIRVPKTGIATFQLAKLEQDQDRKDDAVKTYERAIKLFDREGDDKGRYDENLRWALRYVGSVAFSREDYPAAEKALARASELPHASPSDWRALGAARGRQRHWADAATAWMRAHKLDPVNGDDAHYAGRLAETAATIAPVADAAPDGTRFKAMERADLEAFLRKEADEARAERAAALKAAPLDPKARANDRAKLLAIRRLFVGAGLEYALRGFPIRETAFHDGYAPLVFQDLEWTPDPGPR